MRRGGSQRWCLPTHQRRLLVGSVGLVWTPQLFRDGTKSHHTQTDNQAPNYPVSKGHGENKHGGMEDSWRVWLSRNKTHPVSMDEHRAGR
ncbi:hypothetical protein JAAARDRAFT_445998 [Jaapia argillacea MUCL 33604]|uniref:Uncharacterized protein n=1 Tax=Jaapia argillacea MUCL 33604 TaxID=933084 RepID=A0A067PGC7_9AGAM|nr:hypothetical protein JAAARDRAFT_445998 [Jaapia argillacea MUCL 33604]